MLNVINATLVGIAINRNNNRLRHMHMMSEITFSHTTGLSPTKAITPDKITNYSPSVMTC